jgi:hypothetical protein
LGIKNPEFITTDAGIRQVMANFQRYAEGMLQNAEGWDRRWRLDALSQQLGITADQIAMLMKANEKLALEVGKDTTIHERFKQQIAETGQGLLRLSNTLLGLLSGTLYPVVWILNRVISALNEFLNLMVEIKGIAVALMSTLGLGILVLAVRMRHLAAAFIEVMLAGRAAEITARAQSRAYAAQMVGMGTIAAISSGILLVAKFFNVYTLAFTFIVAELSWIFSRFARAQEETNRFNREMRDKLWSQQHVNLNKITGGVYRQVLTGDVADLLSKNWTIAFERLFSKGFKTEADKLKTEAKYYEAVRNVIMEANYLRTMTPVPRLEDEREKLLNQTVNDKLDKINNTLMAIHKAEKELKVRETAEAAQNATINLQAEVLRHRVQDEELKKSLGNRFFK